MILCFTFTPGIHWTLIFFFYAGFQDILFPSSEPINPEPSLKSHSFHYTVPIIINQIILCVCVCCCCCCWVASVVSDSVWPQRRQPTRLPCPWDSPGKNTGVGCRFLLQCMKGKSESEVAQSCPTLSDPMDCSPPGSSVHGIFQARVPEWGAIVCVCMSF